MEGEISSDDSGLQMMERQVGNNLINKDRISTTVGVLFLLFKHGDNVLLFSDNGLIEGDDDNDDTR